MMTSPDTSPSGSRFTRITLTSDAEPPSTPLDEDDSKYLLETPISVNPLNFPVLVNPAHKNASLGSSIINLCNTILGAGMLGIPFALANTGMALGCTFLVLSGVAAAFGLNLLSDSATLFLHHRSTFPLDSPQRDMDASYFTVASISYPRAAKIIDAAVAIKCFGVAVSYLIVIGGLMPAAIDSMASGAAPSEVTNRYFWIGMSALILIPLSFLKRLDSLKFTSAIALFSVAYLLALVIGFYGYVGNTNSGIEFDQPGIEMFRWSPRILKFLPIFIFGFTCHQNLFSIFNELGTNFRRTPWVIFISVSICFVIYITIGILGYLTFGSTVSSNIVSDYDPKNVFVLIARIAIAILVTFSYPLQVHPCRASLDRLLFSRQNSSTRPQVESQVESSQSDSGEREISKPTSYIQPHFQPQWRYIAITVAILILSYGIAFLVKDLDVVFGIVGATGSTTICYILPGLFYVKLHSEESWRNGKISAPHCLH
eukprot:TRINITY_DN9771_c0_g1_i1.p1 TRINITY_DN9771_c0_g1~~TRINITY_DN9771_c0_g1_i1.p1  ORF type:complete len:485 (-),score=103.86 TRINITY_DN9771_c0_g1_i1:8-1462(-)